eukprot:6180645-Pyramimonas_sp.AAC.1
MRCVSVGGAPGEHVAEVDIGVGQRLSRARSMPRGVVGGGCPWPNKRPYRTRSGARGGPRCPKSQESPNNV